MRTHTRGFLRFSSDADAHTGLARLSAASAAVTGATYCRLGVRFGSVIPDAVLPREQRPMQQIRLIAPFSSGGYPDRCKNPSAASDSARSH